MHDLVADYPRCPRAVSREIFLLYRPHAVREDVFLYVWEVVVGHYTTVILPFSGGVRGWPGLERVLFIIDNLMNLELMFWASAASGNKTLGDMATSHAQRTGKLWLRADGSTAHLCVFDPATGKLQNPCTGTPQGLAADSTWARGQGWAIYGWTLAYRYTQDKSFLPFAEKAAAFYLSAALDAQKTLIPKWDFNAIEKS